MPRENIINCPACGFSVKAGSKSCDFCGYEFEANDFTGPSTARTVGDASALGQPSSKGPSRNGTRKSNSSKKGTRSQSRSNGNGKNGSNTRRSKTQESEGQAGAAVERTPVVDVSETDPDPQKRIKELEKQLTDAEKELDEISKLLGPGHSKPEQGAAAATITPQVKVRQNPPPVEVVPSRVASRPMAAEQSASGNYASTDSASVSSGARLFFRFRGMTVGAIVVGIIVYALSFVLMQSIGQVEMYLLILPASILVALGLYASLEASPASQRL